ncbi:hypothetical protein PITC_001980 [Penicillium italicum]|uniref:Rhodopsin domain-containing protein n=1 Tax=Penicillium italicum TaxID=40296 RepID=A0A0A2L5U2_PENIT|nr:hypothetical protein PITC_001980 [Penicillium italicum]
MYVLIVSSIFAGVAALTVTLRLYARFYLVKAPGLDDLFILYALLVDLALLAFLVLEQKHGIGTPVADLSKDNLQGQLFWLWISVPFYNLSMILAKFSALSLYARLFRPYPFLLATYILMGFLVILGLWTTLSGFFFCIPINAFWSPSAEIRATKCLPATPVWFTNAALQTSTDMVILILPMPLLWKLQLPRRQKWGILVVFSLGIIAIATSVARMYPLSVMVSGGDFTNLNAQAALWSSLEVNVSIICICLPPLHPVFSRIFSFCFLPRPIQSRASKFHSNRTQANEPLNRDRGIWCTELFSPGPASYSASISKVDTNEDEQGMEEGIRVKRELRMQTDTLYPPVPRSHYAKGAHLDMEMEGPSRSTTAPGYSSVEGDLGSFEFPDYKERMNAPI